VSLARAHDLDGFRFLSFLRPGFAVHVSYSMLIPFFPSSLNVVGENNVLAQPETALIAARPLWEFLKQSYGGTFTELAVQND
jgi:hypothetical protein